MKRMGILGAGVGLAAVLTMSSIVAAVSSNISPHTQSHAHGVASSWTLTWGNTSPYDVSFWWDVNDTYADWFKTGTTTTSKSLSHAWWPCQGSTFRQELDVFDAHGLAIDTSNATEAGGNPC